MHCCGSGCREGGCACVGRGYGGTFCFILLGTKNCPEKLSLLMKKKRRRRRRWRTRRRRVKCSWPIKSKSRVWTTDSSNLQGGRPGGASTARSPTGPAPSTGHPVNARNASLPELLQNSPMAMQLPWASHQESLCLFSCGQLTAELLLVNCWTHRRVYLRRPWLWRASGVR